MLSSSAAQQIQRSSTVTIFRLIEVVAPTVVFLSVAYVAHAQGTIHFSGAQTLMGQFKTFAVYAGAVICFGGGRCERAEPISMTSHFQPDFSIRRWKIW
jgi:hypothetical protein